MATPDLDRLIDTMRHQIDTATAHMPMPTDRTQLATVLVITSLHMAAAVLDDPKYRRPDVREAFIATARAAAQRLQGGA